MQLLTETLEVPVKDEHLRNVFLRDVLPGTGTRQRVQDKIRAGFKLRHFLYLTVFQ